MSFKRVYFERELLDLKLLFHNFSLSGESKRWTAKSPSNNKISGETHRRPWQEGGCTESWEEEEKEETLGKLRYVCRKAFIYFSGYGVDRILFMSYL